MSTRNFTVEKDWTTAAGLRAVVIMGTIGFRCGYVGVPQGHPLHGVGYDDVRQADGDWLDVHGGLTFADGYGTYPVESNLWFFGYDCGHAGDGHSPEYLAQQRIRYPGQPFMWEDGDDVFRSLDYCEQECESLARQLAKVDVRAAA